MTITPSSEDLDRMTPTDARNALLITLLMLNAKVLQVATKGLEAGRSQQEKDEAGKALAAFVFQITTMYGDGHRLETDVLALGKQIGFDVEQHYLSPEARA